MKNYSQGKWTIKPGTSLRGIEVDKTQIAVIQGENVEADSKLMASSPDLLRSVEELLSLLSFHGYNNSAEIYEAKRAIEKATN